MITLRNWVLNTPDFALISRQNVKRRPHFKRLFTPDAIQRILSGNFNSMVEDSENGYYQDD